MTKHEFDCFMTILDTILLAIKATNVLLGLTVGMLFTILIKMEFMI